MAEQAILEVSLKNYKQQIDDLRASLLNLDSTSQEYQQTAGQIKDMQEKLNEVMGIGKKQVDGVDGSYNQLSQTLSKLKQEWKTLEIGSDRWKELGAEINSLNDKLKDADASVGVFSRNVGNYTKSFEDAFKGLAPALGNISPELGKIGSTLTRMIPVIKSVNATATAGLKGVKAAIASTGIGALVIAIGLLTNYITKNWGAIKDWIKGTTQARKDIKAFKEEIDALKKSHERYINFLKSDGADAFEIYIKNIDYARKMQEKLFWEYAKVVDEFGKKSDEAKEAQSAWTASVEAYNTSILDAKDGIQLFINEMERAEQQQGMTQLQKDLDNNNRKFEHMIELVKQLGLEGKYTAEEVAQITAALDKFKVQEDNRIKSAAGKSAWQKEMDEIKNLIKQLKDYQKTDLQVLEDTYNEQLKLFKKHHKDTTALTEKFLNDRKRMIRETEAENRRVYAETISALNSGYTFDALNAELDDAEKNFKEFTAIIGKEWPPEPPIENTIKLLNEEMVEAAYRIGIISTKTKEELAAAWVLAAQKVSDARKAVKDYNKEWLKTQQLLEKVDTDEELALSTQIEGTEEYMELQKSFAKQRIEALEAYLEKENEVEDKTEERIEAEKQVYIQLNKEIQALAEMEKQQKRMALERRQQAFENNATKAGMNTDTSGLWNNTNFESTYQARIEAAQNYLDTVRQMEYENNELREQAELEAQQRLYEITREYNEAKIQNYSDLAASLGSIFGSIGDLYAQSIANQVKYDGLSEKEAEKQYKKVQALKVSEAIVQTLQGALAAFMGYQSLGQPWGGILGAAAAAAVTAAGAVQIAQIKSQNPYSNGNVNASSYKASTPVLNTYNPDYVANLTGAQDTTYLANALADNPIRAYVVEADVTAKQEVSRARDNETTF